MSHLNDLAFSVKGNRSVKNYSIQKIRNNQLFRRGTIIYDFKSEEYFILWIFIIGSLAGYPFPSATWILIAPWSSCPSLTLTLYELVSIEFPCFLNVGKVDVSCLEDSYLIHMSSWSTLCVPCKVLGTWPVLTVLIFTVISWSRYKQHAHFTDEEQAG